MTTHLLVAEANSTTLGTSIFVALSMLILLYCIKKFAWNSITEILKKREMKISNDLDSAEESRKKADRLADKREKELQHSRQDALAIIHEAKEAAERKKQVLLVESKNEAQKMKDKAKQDIEIERQQSLQEVRQDVAEMSIKIAEKILQKELTETTHKELIDSYIEGLEK